jgi:outer membrane protein assembly factor BamB
MNCAVSVSRHIVSGEGEVVNVATGETHPIRPGTMYVLDAATGGLRWTAPIGSTQSPSAGVVGGAIYVTSDDRKIHAFDIATQAELWPPFAVGGTPGSPAIVDGRIIVGTSFGEVISMAGGGAP